MIIAMQLVLFLVFATVFFFTTTVPGLLLLQGLRVQAASSVKLLIATVLGLCLVGIQAYVLGYAGLRNLSILLVLPILFGAFRVRTTLWRTIVQGMFELRGMGWVALILLGLGVLTQSLQMVGSGIAWDWGMQFFRVHAQDGVFHLSLIERMTQTFPPEEPGLSGILVQNYHYWSDLIIAEYVRIFGFATHDVFFRFFPILISLGTGVALVLLLHELADGKFMHLRRPLSVFGLFFLYFGADSAYILMLWLHGKFGFYTSVIDSGVTQFLNMPHATAKLVFLTALLVLFIWHKRPRWHTAMILIVLTAVLFGLKIYTAFVFGLCLTTLALVYTVKLAAAALRGQTIKRAALERTRMLYGLGAVSLIGALAIYLPPNKGSGGLGWYPLEWVKLFLADENLEWKDLRYKRAVAELMGLRGKIIAYDLIGIAATLWSIHGTRLLGLVPGSLTRTLLGKTFLVVFFVPMLICTGLGLFTLQESGSFNVFNFFASSLTLMAITASIVLTQVWQYRSVLARCAVIVVIALTLPRSLYETHKIITSYQQSIDVATVTQEEIDVLAQVDALFPAEAVIQSHPSNGWDMSTPYVSYFAKRPSFIAGVNVLETHNLPIDRASDLHKLYATTDANTFHQLLTTYGIDGLYLRSGEALPVDPALAKLTLVYENSGNRIYRVD